MERTILVALLALTTTLLCPGGASAQDGRWLRLESPSFIVYTAGNEQRAYAAVSELESFDALLRRITDAPAARSPTKLNVYLLTSDQFHDTFHMNESILGFYRAGVEEISAFAIFREGSGLGGDDVLFHEYAHHFMYAYFNNAYPAWYVEGFAEFVATAVLGTERITLGRSETGRAYDLTNGGTWMPMEQLITLVPNDSMNAHDMEMFYAQSWLFTHYLVLTPGKMAQFQAYVRALRQGQAPNDAFQTGFGMTPAQMQGVLRTYLRGSPNAIALTRPAEVEHNNIEATHLPPIADNLLMYEARLRAGIRDENKTEVLQQVRQIVGSQPTDRFALLTLARAEDTLGSRDTARALLEPYLAAHADDVDALYLMGLSYLRDADDAHDDARTQLLSQARRYFGRGYRRDGNHVPTLARYSETYAGVMMDEATYTNYMNVLLLAHQLAPQVHEISINTASALMTVGRNAEAIPILRALAYDPHAGGYGETAEQMLEQAQTALARANAGAAAAH